MNHSISTRRVGRAVAGLACLGAAAAMIAATPPHATTKGFPGENGRIAYTHIVFGEDGSSEIRSVRPDGSGETTLAGGGAAGAAAPAFAANGRWIAFTVQRAGRDSELWRMRHNGNQKQRLTRNRRIEHSPTWSPNGRWLAFAGIHASQGDIHVMRSSGGRSKRLTRNGLDEYTPAWSPDGRRIAFVRVNRRGKQVIATMRPNGRGLSRVAIGSSPTWSPNGRWIAFERAHNGQMEIFAVRANGKGLQPVTQLGSDEMHPEWSPDGRWITFTRDFDELWRVRAGGTGLRPVVAPGGTDGAVEPSWQSR